LIKFEARKWCFTFLPQIRKTTEVISQSDIYDLYTGYLKNQEKSET